MPIVLESGSLVLKCSPEHGFVITEIVDKSTGINFLWEAPNASLADLTGAPLGPSGDASIAVFDREILAGGWFPMFPTAGLPDGDESLWMHGEAPRVAWSVTEGDASYVTAEVELPISRFHLDRTVTVIGDLVVVEMTAVNNGHGDTFVTLGEHPCFDRNIFAGGRLDVGQPAAAWTELAGQPGAATLPDHSSFSWPRTIGRSMDDVDLSVIPESADGRHDHVILKPSTGVARISSANFDVSLELRYDSSVFPYLLLWEHFFPTNSQWPGDVFALEPMSFGGTNAGHAKSRAERTVVPRGASVSYSVSLAVVRAKNDPGRQRGVTASTY